MEEKFFYAIVINVNQLGHGSIVTLNIDDIQGVCFLGNLVQIVANAVELLHHSIVVRGWSITSHLSGQ